MTLVIYNNIDASGTSFHGTTIRASLRQLIALIGTPIHGFDKTTHEWYGKVNDQIFTIYDWKEGSFTPDALIDWHIGGFDNETTEAAKTAIMDNLYQLVPYKETPYEKLHSAGL